MLRWSALSSGLRVFAHMAGKGVSAFLLALLCIEALLRSFVVCTPAWTQDPILGKIMKPGPFVNGGEGFCRTTIGPYGFRNAEIPPKTMNEFRLVALGDSSTEANHVSDADTFPKLLEHRLAGAFPRNKILVLNAGKPGAYPGDYIGYKPVMDCMEPDYMIVQWDESDITSDLTSSGTTYQLISDQGKYRLQRGEETGEMERLLGPFSVSLSFLSSISTVRRVGEKITLMQAVKQTIPKKKKTPDEKAAQERQRAEKVSWLLRQLKATYPKLVCVYIPRLDYAQAEQEYTKIPFAESNLMQASETADVVMLNMRQAFLDHFRRTHQPQRC